MTTAATFVPPTVTPPAAPLPTGRMLLGILSNPIATLPQAVYEQGVVRSPLRLGRATVWVTDPVLVERILLGEHELFRKSPLERRVFKGTLGDGILTSQDASWKWQRRTAAPLFRPMDLAALVPAMAAEADTQLDRWRPCVPGSVQPIAEHMSEMTFRVISATMFKGSATADSETFWRASETSLNWVTWELVSGIAGLPEWVWHPGKWPRARAAAELRRVCRDLLQRRRAEGLKGHDDLLARLALARDPDTGALMDEEQVIDNLLTFLAAGHETTAKALTWTLYLLARAPEWQDRLRSEVLDVAGATKIEHAHIERLVATRQVLKEAMRLYPPAPMMTRIATADGRLGDVDIAAGTVTVLPIYAIHRHRKLWSEPDRFDPTRFSPEREKSYHRAQYMPFGFGPRLCIGMSFAMLEAQALLATLVRGARFAWDGKHVPTPQSRVTLRPKEGMPLEVTVLT
jgi:cytochrome P450